MRKEEKQLVVRLRNVARSERKYTANDYPDLAQRFAPEFFEKVLSVLRE